MELAKPDPARAPTRKSVPLSGALSLVFGPIGWIYAAPLKEAAPVIAAYLLLVFILPKLLFFYVFLLLHLVAGAAGVLYAWSYNREGRRLPLILKDPPARLPPGPR
jgi:hypothetical protein